MSLRETYIKELRGLAAQDIDSVEMRWQSPSNIALIKYWGKHGNQLPMNPSVSFTLSKCFSDTYFKLIKKTGPSSTINVGFTLDQKASPVFSNRIKDYFDSIKDLCPFLTGYDIIIESSNSFPHSAGIASSASGFSALALCLTTMEDNLYGNLDDDLKFRRKASYLSRLGSGSASRSIYKRASWWGESPEIADSSDEFAVDVSELLHPIFNGFQDSVLIVSSDKKPVSSSHGHQLMDFHPYRKGRLHQADQHLRDMKSALQIGDLERFGHIVESEALSLHALMLSSSPGYFLISGETIAVIRAIRAFRESEKIPCYFTLDAGPNVHLLYPQQFSTQVKEFIIDELEPLTDHVIYDELGNGPVQLS